MVQDSLSDLTRRKFLQTSAVTVAGSAIAGGWPQSASGLEPGGATKPARPIVVSSGNGLTPFNGAVPLETALQAAYDQIKDRKGFLTPEGVFVKEEAI